ncbi:MAG: aldolase [Proteobacteria bacterium]|nr:aldolase [Pseudomonadota bacterium]
MPIYKNYAKERLKRGEVTIGLGLRQARTVDIAQIAKTCGYDWLFIDMEHSSLNLDTAIQIAVAALPLAITPIVRVPGHEVFHLNRTLDSGAMGVVIPHVNTAEEAAHLVKRCKFPPVGERGVFGAAPHTGFEKMDLKVARKAMNDEQLIIVQIEEPLAADNAEAIAAVPGVDALLIGTNDFCASIGADGKFDHPKVRDAYEKVIAACRKHGKFPGTAGVTVPEITDQYIRMGAILVLAGNDINFMMASMTARANALHALKPA